MFRIKCEAVRVAKRMFSLFATYKNNVQKATTCYRLIIRKK